MDIENFHTIVQLPEYRFKTGYTYNHMFFGSCFTENIGNLMANLKYQTDINPFGILYNPVSIANGLKILLAKRSFSSDDLIFTDGLWHSFYHHSRFSFLQKDDALSTINERINSSGENLKETDFLFITFGTAFVYEYIESGKIVSNCHKIPNNRFRKYKLTVEQITTEYITLAEAILKANPKIKIVFTVSPIRHWSDGAIENQRSKATLILAIAQIISHFGNNCCAYFPSYEIVMDELRDYRFYSADMLHLSETAINYIWKVFENSMIEQGSIVLSRQIDKLQAALNHNPFNRDSKEHLRFLERTLVSAEKLQTQYNRINISSEVDFLKKEIEEIRSFLKHD